jgi:serine/threonine-protein kinase HipA
MYTELSEEGLNDLIKSLPTNPLCIGMGSSVRLSLAGAQNKTTLFRQDGMYYVPINGAPSSHILKAPITNIEGIVDTVHNETFIMMLAKVVGLNVPRVEMVMIGGIPVFVIDRYDRMADNSGVMQRLLQEDFCQLLMYEPTVKYQHSGGPTIEDCATKIREHSSDFITDIEQLLKWVAFNIVIGNADAHGKNLSMLWGSDGIRLAPFYDMLSTGIYGKYHDAGYAMSIGRQFDANKLERGDWKTLAEYLDINIRLLDQINKEMLDIIRPAAHSTAERFKETYGDNRTVDKIVAEIEMRAVMLKRAVQD